MNEEAQSKGTPQYKIVAALLSAIIVFAAVALLVVVGPSLKRPTPGKQLAAALADRMPGSEPEVTIQDGTVFIALLVPYDPAVDAQRAYEAFQTALSVAEQQELTGVEGAEITLSGRSLDGAKTTQSREFDYTPVSRQGLDDG